MAQISLQNVSKTYRGGVEAIQNLSLEVADGQLMVLVGPSGCGKSTILRMIAGLEEVSSGTISIDDRVVNQLPPQRRDVAMVFQNHALMPQMTVRENMAFGLKLRKTNRNEIVARVAEAAQSLGLSDLLDRRVNQLSGGEQQRVAVGRTIVRDPALFLFDEPLSNLDARMRVRMRVEISQLQRRLGQTMIYVTHDQTEAMAIGDLIAVMDQGRIEQVAAPQVLYDRPANMFVAGFIGSLPMNFFRGELVAENGHVTFAGKSLKFPLPESQSTSLASHLDRPVVLGLRPHDIGPAHQTTANAVEIEATIELIESLGAETVLHVVYEDESFVCLADRSRDYQTGEKITLVVDTCRCHLFDADTQQAIGVDE